MASPDLSSRVVPEEADPASRASEDAAPGVEYLVDRVRLVVKRRLKPAATSRLVARALAPALDEAQLLRPGQQAGSADGYQQHVLHVEADGSFSVVALVWLPGQATPIHDHVSWCAVGVYRGEETETRYRLTGEGARRRLVVAERLVNERGSADGIAPPGDIHQVQNTGSEVAISMHVYGADIGVLGSSIRRCYDLPVTAA